MKQIKSFGTLLPTYSLSEQVSVSTDTVQFDPESKYKVYVQLEPPEVLNNTWSVIANHKNFDLMLVWNKEILDKCPNAKKFIFGTSTIDLNTFKSNKQNQISFLMSDKNFAPGHRLRHEVFSKLNGVKKINDFDLLTIKSPPRIPTKDVIFENAKFSITIENSKRDNWISEKLIDCFATKTIPIYYGCPNVGEFFNEKGVISFTSADELGNILNMLTPELYDRFSNEIEENYQKSLQYFDFHERVKSEINNFISLSQ